MSGGVPLKLAGSAGGDSAAFCLVSESGELPDRNIPGEKGDELQIHLISICQLLNHVDPGLYAVCEVEDFLK